MEESLDNFCNILFHSVPENMEKESRDAIKTWCFIGSYLNTAHSISKSDIGLLSDKFFSSVKVEMLRFLSSSRMLSTLLKLQSP